MIRACILKFGSKKNITITWWHIVTNYSIWSPIHIWHHNILHLYIHIQCAPGVAALSTLNTSCMGVYGIAWCTVYPKKYAHGFCFAVLCCGYTLTDFPISIRLTSLALWQSNDCPSASKATLMNMDKYFMWIHYERLHNHNKAKHNKTVCIFLGIYCMYNWFQWQHMSVKASHFTGHWRTPTHIIGEKTSNRFGTFFTGLSAINERNISSDIFHSGMTKLKSYR